jgi:hypothetical protein
LVTEIITAIRYGKRGCNEFVFEVYNGHVVGGNFPHFELFEKREYRLEEGCVQHGAGCGKGCSPIDEFTRDPHFTPLSLEALNQLIVLDAKVVCIIIL